MDRLVRLGGNTPGRGAAARAAKVTAMPANGATLSQDARASLKRLYEFGPKIDIVNHECNGIGGNGELAPVDAGM